MRVFSVLLCVIAAAACNKATTETEAAATRTVIVEEAAFVPNNVVVRQGGIVRFTFQGTAHSVIFTEQPGRPENIEPPVANTTEERVFLAEGTYSYTCAEHRSTMNGTVTVERFTPAGGP